MVVSILKRSCVFVNITNDMHEMRVFEKDAKGEFCISVVVRQSVYANECYLQYKNHFKPL